MMQATPEYWTVVAELFSGSGVCELNIQETMIICSASICCHWLANQIFISLMRYLFSNYCAPPMSLIRHDRIYLTLHRAGSVSIYIEVTRGY
jgi:hypothetical protein